jgi:hypothetical protein
VSLLYVMQNGESAEIAVVGNEGVIGVSLFMGGDSTASRARVLIRVLDRKGLEKRVCECYAVVRKEYHRLLPEKLAA